MSPTKDWNEEEDNFDLTLSQRTEELYRIPNRDLDQEGMISILAEPNLTALVCGVLERL